MNCIILHMYFPSFLKVFKKTQEVYWLHFNIRILHKNNELKPWINTYHYRRQLYLWINSNTLKIISWAKVHCFLQSNNSSNALVFALATWRNTLVRIIPNTDIGSPIIPQTFLSNSLPKIKLADPSNSLITLYNASEL